MQVKSIQCKSCAAPLSLHGNGHRIRTLTCQYCGAVMDVRKDFALLGKLKNKRPPSCPISLGMEGEIKGVMFVVTGIVSYRSNYGDRWTDLHLFSETHGYAWLSYQLGHFTFTRRVRHLPDRDMTKLSSGSPFKAHDISYRYYEGYEASIDYVAGELTWLAKIGDSSVLRDAIAPPFMFSQETTENEQEYHLTEYIDPKEISHNFKLEYETHRSFIHPAQPFTAPLRKALSKASLLPFVLSLLVLVFIGFLNIGNNVLSEKITPAQVTDGLYIRDITINNAKHLLELQFNASRPSSFRVKKITLFDEKNEVFSFDKLHNMTLKSQYGKARFHLNNKGKYTLRMQVSKPDKPVDKASHAYIQVKIQQGIIGNLYFKYLLYLSIISFLTFYISRFLFERKRWSNN